MHYAEQYFNSAASDDEPEDGENNAPGHWKISEVSEVQYAPPPGYRARPTGPTLSQRMARPADKVKGAPRATRGLEPKQRRTHV